MNSSITISKLKSQKLTAGFLTTAMALFLLALFLFSLTIGAVELSVSEISSILLDRLGFTNQNFTAVQSVVLMDIRLPRLIFTILIGTALGVSGAALQGIFRNPLVEPGIIGVSSGAALGAFVVILGLTSFIGEIPDSLKVWLLPPFAFLGGVLATFMTLRLGNYQGKVRVTILILAGVAISALANAIIGLGIYYADDQQLRTFTFWTLGDLSAGTWQKIGIITIPIVASTLILTRMAKSLNAIALGESEAFHSGVNVEKVKRTIVFFSALCVGVAVSFSGIIGFVGLVIPHIIRMAFSSDHRIVIPLSALGGAALLILADLFARTVVAPSELPIGVVTAALGTPFFIYLLTVAKRKNLI